MESNSGAIGPSGESLTFFKEVSKVSANLRAFRGHFCRSVTSKELHQEIITDTHTDKKVGNSILHRFTYAAFLMIQSITSGMRSLSN